MKPDKSEALINKPNLRAIANGQLPQSSSGNVTISYTLVINAKEYHHTFTTSATSKEEAVYNLNKNIQFDEIDMLIIHSITQKI